MGVKSIVFCTWDAGFVFERVLKSNVNGTKGNILHF